MSFLNIFEEEHIDLFECQRGFNLSVRAESRLIKTFGVVEKQKRIYLAQRSSQWNEAFREGVFYTNVRAEPLVS